jgi:hypothetical protein
MSSPNLPSVLPNLPSADQRLIESLAKLDPLAFGIALGALCGLIIFSATNFLLIKGGEEIGQNLWLLSHYFKGFSVTFAGSLIGGVYGFFFGFALGATAAFLRNAIVSIYLNLLKFKDGISAASDFIDNP